MAFGKILSQYRRVDTIEVDCGNDFFVELSSYQSNFKALGREQAKLRAAGLLKDDSVSKKTKFTSVAARQQNVDEDREFVLGSYEHDMKFFASHVVKGWRGAIDDEGHEVPYSPESCIELFSAEGGKELYNDLLLLSMDVANFANLTPIIEEDEKN